MTLLKLIISAKNLLIYTLIWILLLLVYKPLTAQILNHQIIQLPSAVGAANNINNKLIQNPAQNPISNYLGVKNKKILNYVSVTNIPSLFEVEDLAINNLSAGAMLDSNNFVNISLTNLGTNIYNHLSTNVSYTYILPKYAVGISLDYDRMNIQNYNNYNYFGLNLGMLINMTDDFALGVVVTNLNRDYFGDSYNNIPQRVIVGIGGEIIKDFYIDIDAVVNIQNSSSLSLATKYNILNRFNIGFAINSNPQIFEIRTTTNVYEDIDLSLNLSKRMELGYIPVLNLNYCW